MKMKNLATILVLCATTGAFAADYHKANNTQTLNLPASWVEGSVPGSGDTAVWDNTVTAANIVALGADTNWAGIRITNVSGAVTVSAGNTLTLGANGVDLTGASQNLTLSCPVVLGSAQTWAVTNGRTLTVGGIISGTGALTMMRPGTLVMSGANTFSGGFTVTNGSILNPNNNAAFGTGTITLGGGTVCPVGIKPTYANPVVVAAGTINNVFGYNGGTQYPAFSGVITGSGTILNSNYLSGLGNAFINGDISGFTGTVDFENFGSSDNFQFSGTVAGNNFAGSQAHFVANGSTTGAGQWLINNSGTFQMGDLSGTGGRIHGNASSVILQIGALNTSTSFGGRLASISGTTALDKVGTGTLTLYGTLAYTGATTVDNGTLSLSNLPSLTTSGITINSPGVLNLSGAWTLAKTATGAGAVTKSGTGTVVISAAQTYTGSTTVNGGTLQLNAALSTANAITVNAGTLYVGAAQGLGATVAVAANATLGGSNFIGAATIAAGGNMEGGETGVGTLTLSNLTFNGASTVKVYALASPYVPLNVTNALVTGATPVILNIANNPAPGTYHLVQFGTLAGAAFALTPTRTFTLATNGNYIDLVVVPSPGYDVWTGTQTSDWSVNSYAPGYNWELTSNNLALNPVDFLTADSVVLDDSAANNTVNISVANVNPASVTFNNTNKNYVLGGAYGIASGALAKTGTGTLTINNVNTYPGGTTISGGTVEFVSGGLSGGAVTLTTNSTLRWIGNNSAGLPLALSNSITAKLDTTTNNVTQTTTIGGVGSALVKMGIGQLNLNNSNTFTGPTTISQGALMLNNALALPVTANVVLGDANSGTTSPTLGSTYTVTANSLTVGANVTNATIYANPTTGNNWTSFTNIVLNSPLTVIQATAAANWSGFQALGGKITGNGGGAGHDSLILSNSNPTVQGYIEGNGTANDFLGNLHITGGRWRLQNAGGNNLTIPDTASVTLDSGATLEFSTAALPEAIDGLNGVGSIDCNISQTSPFSIGESGGSGYFSGVIQNGTGQLAITKDGSGTQVLAGTNIIYTGATSINGGVLRLENATRFNSSVSLYNGYIGVLEISNTVPWIMNPTNTFAGGAEVLKTGVGAMTITSTNSGFYGTNVIAGGTESIAGDLGGAVVMVNTGGTLDSQGGGISSGIVVVNNGGAISALDSLPFPLGGNLTLGNTGSDTVSLSFNANGSAVAGFLTVNGPLALNGTANINIIGVPPSLPGVYPLITYTSFTGSGALSLGALPPGYRGYVTNDTSAMQVELVLTGVDSLVWVGWPGNSWDLNAGNQIWKLASSSLPSPFANGFSVAFDDTASNFTANVAATVLPTSVTVNATNNYTFQGLPLQYGGNLIKDGSGSLTLVTNTTVGALDLRNGTLLELGTATVTNLTFENGTLQVGNGGPGWLNILSPSVTLGSNTASASVVYNTSTNGTVGTSFTGNGSVLKLGSGTVNLNARNNYGGGTTVNAGTLALDVNANNANPSLDGVGTLTGTVTVNTGAILQSTIWDSMGYVDGGQVTTLNLNGGSLVHTDSHNLTLHDMTINLTGGSMMATLSGGNLKLLGDSNTTNVLNNTVINTYASTNSSIIGGVNLQLAQYTTTFTVADGTVADDLLVTAPITESTPGCGLDKEGDGTMTITGLATNTGSTTVNGGVLKLVDNVGWASPLTVNAPATLELSNNATWNFGQSLNGTGGNLVKSGPGMVTLSQTIGSSGTIVVNGGTLLMPGVNSATSVTVNSNGVFGGQGSVSAPVTVNNGGGLTAPQNNPLQMSALTLGMTSTDVQTLTFSANGTTVAGNMQVYSYNGLVVNGTNIVNITGLLPQTVPCTNTLIAYSAASPVGATHFMVGSMPERATGYVIDTGTEIDLVITSINPIYWVGAPTNTWDNVGDPVWRLANLSVASYTNNTDAVVFDGTSTNYQVNVTASVNPYYTLVTGPTNYVFQGSPIQSAGILSVQGPGSATFTANGNSFAGINLTGGTLQIGTNGANGSVNLPSTMTIGSGATLAYDRNGSITPDASVTFTGNGTLKQVGTGTLTLSNANNSYTGGTTISRGIVALSVSGAGGSGTVTLGDANTGTNNTELSFINVSVGATFENVIISTNGTGTATISGTANPSGANPEPTAQVTMNRTTTLKSNNSSGASDFAGQLTGPGAGAGNTTLVINANGGTMRYTATTIPNDFAGNILITNGVFQVQNLSYNGYTPENNNLAIPDTASVTVAAGATLHFAHTLFEVIDGLNGAGTADNGYTTSGNVCNLIVGGNNGNGNFSGVLQNSSANGFALTKIGTGTQILGGASTYTKPTIVSNGVLAVNGSLAAGSAVYVAPGGTLAGTGSIGGVVTNDGTISPGLGSIGTLTLTGNTTLNTDGTVYMKVSRPAHDQLNAGNLTYGGSLTVANTGGAFHAGDSFQLVNALSYAGNFTAMNLPALGSGLNWNWNVTNGTLSVVGSVATNPTNVTYSVTGGTLHLSWPADHLGWHLQSQTNTLATGLGTNWVTIPGSDTITSTNIPVNPATPAVFYRLVYP